MQHTFNKTELLDRIDNDWEFLTEIVQMLSTSGRGLLQQLRAAAAAGDAPAVARAAHTLKGMISNFCAPAAQASAAAVEQIGKGGNLAALPAALDTLQTDAEALIAELTEMLATRA